MFDVNNHRLSVRMNVTAKTFVIKYLLLVDMSWLCNSHECSAGLIRILDNKISIVTRLSEKPFYDNTLIMNMTEACFGLV